MSYPYQGDSDFPIYTAPQAPQTARALVEDLGVEAVRDALPSSEQRAFDQANPYRDIERASDRVTARANELNAFDQDIQRHIAERGYTPEQAQVVYQQTADVRQPLLTALESASATANQRLNTYQENLIRHIDSRRLVERVAAQTGLYSTAVASTSAAAALDPSGGNRPSRDGGSGRPGRGSDRNPLGETHGNRRRGRR